MHPCVRDLTVHELTTHITAGACVRLPGGGREQRNGRRNGLCGSFLHSGRTICTGGLTAFFFRSHPQVQFKAVVRSLDGKTQGSIFVEMHQDATGAQRWLLDLDDFFQRHDNLQEMYGKVCR